MHKEREKTSDMSKKEVKINFFEAYTLFLKSVTNIKNKGVLWLHWDQAKELGDSRCAVRLHPFQVTGKSMM